MACYHPSKVDVNRRLRGDQTRRDTVTVPCGKCLGCRADQAREWAIRLSHTAALYPKSSWFITLTYEDKHLPGQWPDDKRTRGTLDPEEMTLFLKRLRRSKARKIRYFLCGEYGEKTLRPHYHMALFGARLGDKQQIGTRKGTPVFHHQGITDTWGMGSVEVASLSWKSASYVAGYVTKKVVEKANPTNHLRVDPDNGEILEVEPEFQRMSRRPALGREWLERHWEDVYPRDFVVMDGSPFKPPRYYDKRMEVINPEIMEEVRHQRFIDAEEIGDEKLIMKEKIHRARMRLFDNRKAL